MINRIWYWNSFQFVYKFHSIYLKSKSYCFAPGISSVTIDHNHILSKKSLYSKIHILFVRIIY